MELHRLTQISFWDALIVSRSAIGGGAGTVYRGFAARSRPGRGARGESVSGVGPAALLRRRSYVDAALAVGTGKCLGRAAPNRDLNLRDRFTKGACVGLASWRLRATAALVLIPYARICRSEEHTSELQ